jgi:stage II sporulation protein P
VAADLTQALSWDLTEEAPTVLILHSHGTEGYLEQADGGYRSENTEENMIAIGDRLVQVLESGGVRAVHDRQLHDSPSYSDAYGNARESIAYYLEQYPSIRLVLDLHRDAVESGDGTQTGFVTQVKGEPTAQLMLVVGTDASGLSHPHWPENMSLAVKLHAQLERIAPGICRPINFRSQRFNQDLSPGALIVEVGGAGNSREEAIRSAEVLGQAVLELAQGTTAG